MIKILEADRIIFTWINAGWSNPVFDLIIPLISHLADPVSMWFWIIFLGLAAYRKSPEFKIQNSGKKILNAAVIKTSLRYSLYIAFIYGVNTLIYHSIKQIVSRPRPFVSYHAIVRVSNPEMSGLNHLSSFPSGHAANAFMAAVILSVLFPGKRLFFYLIAAFIGLSRIYLGVHYPLDIFAGALLSISVTLITLRYLGRYTDYLIW